MKAQKSILLVEDASEVRKMMARYIESWGFRVVEAADGMEGLQRLESEEFDLVITDIVMPFVSGAGIVRAVKARSPATPVIAITGQGKVPEDLAAESHADLVLEKPIHMADLEAYVRRLMGEHS